MGNNKITLKQILTKLVGIKSIYPNENGMTLWLENFLENNGWYIQKQRVGPNRFNLFATKGRGQSAILFYGHVDTVETNETFWTTNPYKLTQANTNYIGLGTYDMKGGIAAFLDAANKTTSYTKLFLAVDEENISEGAWKAVSKRKDFFEDVALIISAEPNFGFGLNGITVGRTGRCIFEVVFKGVAKHIAEYKEAKDAIKYAGEFIGNLYRSRDRIFKSLDTVAQVRKLLAESRGMSVCDEAYLEIEVLIGAGETIESIQKVLQSLHPKSQVQLKSRKTPYLEGYAFDIFPYRDLINKIVQNYTYKKLVFHTRKSVGDDNVLATLGIPVITWGPDGGNAHTANEYVDIRSLNTLSQMYFDLLEKRR